MHHTLLLVFLLVGVANGQVTLNHLDTEYLPRCYACRKPYQSAYNHDVVEQIAFDDNGPYIYVVGLNLISVLNYTTPTALEISAYNKLPIGTVTKRITDVEACGDYIAVAIDTDDGKSDGTVAIMRSYYPGDPYISLSKIHTITVGVLPDMVKFTSDCRKIVVAVEGSVYSDNGEIFDPEGEVVVISFNETHFTSQKADFTAFNDRAGEYVSRGVRWVYRGDGNTINTTFSQDLEPEYIDITADDATAYIVLQENNAIAELDIATASITEIYPLTPLSWADSAFDANDNRVIDRLPWNVMSLGQPDGIKLITIGGESYILTADEGDPKRFFDLTGELAAWSDVQHGRDFTVDEVADAAMMMQLQDPTKLSELHLSTVDGINEQGQYETFYSLGQRSFSLYKTSDFSLVYNSRGEIEEKIAQLYPNVFNSNPKLGRKTPEETMDDRSNDQGPEPESIETAVIDGTTLVFVGIERPGFIAVYALDDSASTPTFNFQDLIYNGGSGSGMGWKDLYNQRETSGIRDLDPEDIKFISASDANNPSGMNMIAVSGSYTGTVSLYQVQMPPTTTTVTEPTTTIPTSTTVENSPSIPTSAAIPGDKRKIEEDKDKVTKPPKPKSKKGLSPRLLDLFASLKKTGHFKSD